MIATLPPIKCGPHPLYWRATGYSDGTVILCARSDRNKRWQRMCTLDTADVVPYLTSIGVSVLQLSTREAR